MNRKAWRVWPELQVFCMSRREYGLLYKVNSLKPYLRATIHVVAGYRSSLRIANWWNGCQRDNGTFSLKSTPIQFRNQRYLFPNPPQSTTSANAEQSNRSPSGVKRQKSLG